LHALAPRAGRGADGVRHKLDDRLVGPQICIEEISFGFSHEEASQNWEILFVGGGQVVVARKEGRALSEVVSVEMRSLRDGSPLAVEKQ